MTVKLPTEHHLEFLSLKGGCTGSSDSTHVKMPHGWKSYVAAQIALYQPAPSCCLIRGIYRLGWISADHQLEDPILEINLKS